MRRVLEEALPEKSAVLSLASESLERIKREEGLSGQQGNAVSLLLGCFVTPPFRS